MQITQLSILNDFSEYPKLRYCNLSDNSAEKFYHDKLNHAFAEAYQNQNILEVDLSNTAGYTSSFLDEAFGNLVYDFTLEVVEEFLTIVSSDEPYWIDMIKTQTFPQWEQRRKKGEAPKKTSTHPAWFKLLPQGELQSKIWINV